jgi:hypothetical protein
MLSLPALSRLQHDDLRESTVGSGSGRGFAPAIRSSDVSAKKSRVTCWVSLLAIGRARSAVVRWIVKSLNGSYSMRLTSRFARTSYTNF